MSTMSATVSGRRWLVALALVALAGCGDADSLENDPDSRGSVGGGGGAASDVGGAGGSGAQAAAVGGSSGAGGARVELGGTTGAAGAGAGGMTGAGGARATYDPCDVYGWSGMAATTCTKLVSVGVYQTGTKDGHICKTCAGARPAGTPTDCTRGSTNDLCVTSCNECVFQ